MKLWLQRFKTGGLIMGYMRGSVWKNVDWWTIGLYLILVICGWFSVCGASYDYGEPNFFDITTRAGKQLMWIGCSLGLGFVILMLEDRVYDTYAYLLYGIMILLLFGTMFTFMDCIRPRKSATCRIRKICDRPCIREIYKRIHFPDAAHPQSDNCIGHHSAAYGIDYTPERNGFCLSVSILFFNALQRRDDRNSSILRNLCCGIFYRRAKIRYRNYA